MNEFARYGEMKAAGVSVADVYRFAKSGGLDRVSSIRMLRQVFGLTLAEAKEVTLVADGVASSLDEHQRRFAGDLAQALSKDTEK